MTKLTHYKDVESTYIDNDVAKKVTGRVVIGKADGAENFCMRVFELGEGGQTPRHSHEWEHEIFVHEGEGRVLKDGNWESVGPGHVVFVPGDVEHQIQNAGSTPFVFVCLIPKGYPEL